MFSIRDAAYALRPGSTTLRHCRSTRLVLPTRRVMVGDPLVDIDFEEPLT
jgi:hypothetical protein